MEKVILIRYGELYLKGRNKGYFERMLSRNITNALKGVNCKFDISRNRAYIVDFDESLTDTIVERVSKVFGIHSLSVAVKTRTDLEEIDKLAAQFAPESGTFRVTVKRADKSVPYTSQQLMARFGASILSGKPNLIVDLHNPNVTINIDIRENGVSYIYYDSVAGAEGMPVGTAGRGLLLLSGGIDSPVAGYMMAKRGMNLNAIHFHSYPYTSELAKEKVIDLANIMKCFCGEMKLFVISFTQIQQSIHKYCREDFMITVMRRIMVRIAERVAKRSKCGALLTGESLGQVASQTLESITCTNSAAVDLPILRPCIGMDKSEIIAISRKMGAYDTSIKPYEDCCTVFLSKNPIIHPEVSVAAEEESKIPNLDKLINECLENIEVIKI